MQRISQFPDSIYSFGFEKTILKERIFCARMKADPEFVQTSGNLITRVRVQVAPGRFHPDTNIYTLLFLIIAHIFLSMHTNLRTLSLPYSEDKPSSNGEKLCFWSNSVKLARQQNFKKVPDLWEKSVRMISFQSHCIGTEISGLFLE